MLMLIRMNAHEPQTRPQRSKLRDQRTNKRGQSEEQASTKTPPSVDNDLNLGCVQHFSLSTNFRERQETP